MRESLHGVLLEQFVRSPVFEMVVPADRWSVTVWGQPTDGDPHGYRASSLRASSALSAAGTMVDWLVHREVRESMFPSFVLPINAVLVMFLERPDCIDWYMQSAFLQSTGHMFKPAHPEVPAEWVGTAGSHVPAVSSCSIVGRMIAQQLMDSVEELTR